MTTPESRDQSRMYFRNQIKYHKTIRDYHRGKLADEEEAIHALHESIRQLDEIDD